MFNSVFKERLTKVELNALDWHERTKNPSINENDLYKFNCWLEIPENMAAYNALELTWEALEPLKNSTEGELLQRNAKNSQVTSGVKTILHEAGDSFFNFKGAALLTSAIAAIVFIILSGQLQLWRTESSQHFITDNAEIKTIQLSDHSSLTLTPNTNLTATFSDKQRLVTLIKGHAFFNVAKDIDRPFIIQHNQFKVQVTGTAFSINTKRTPFTVKVSEGHVRVTKNNERPLNLKNGQQISALNSSSLGQIVHSPSNERTSWEQGKLTFENTKLEKILNEVNGYSHYYFFTNNDELKDMRISLVIDRKNIADLPALLENLLPIKLHHGKRNKIAISLKH